MIVSAVFVRVVEVGVDVLFASAGWTCEDSAIHVNASVLQLIHTMYSMLAS